MGEIGTGTGERRGTAGIEERGEVEIKGHGFAISFGETVEIGDCDFGETVGIKEHCFGESLAAVKFTKRTFPH